MHVGGCDWHSVCSAPCSCQGEAKAAAVLQARGPKVRKQVDRRASKGRRLRFNVHEKLVNFMVPVEVPQGVASQQVLQNLFGQRL